MRIFKRANTLLAALLIVAASAIATFSSCTTTAEYTLGEEFIPGNQQMKIRHRVYKGGMLKETDGATTACKVFETRLFRTDSVKTTSMSQVYIGSQNDARFGKREFSFAGQYLFNKNVNDSVGFGYRPVLDSVMFVFAVDTFAGDTTKPVKFNIYELTDGLVAEGAADTVFYANYDPRSEGHLSEDAEPIFSFTFPDPENGIFTNSKAIRLKETDASKAFIDKLMCKGKLDNNGLANHNAEKYYSSDSAFVHNLPGLYIEVAEAPEGEGAVFALAGASTGIQIMGRTRNAGADADILADTLSIAYHFKSTKESKYGKVSAQGVKFDYSNAEFGDAGYQEQDAQREEVNVGYIEGCGGVFTELNFTDEFLYSLRELNNGDDTFVSAAINQAMLKIYIEGSEYDYNKIEPIAMADKLNSSLTRLGIYTDYKTLTPIPDYLYSQESSGVLYFNGYMNRSLACYEMNISSYIQSLVNEVLNMEENADGTLDFSKLVIPRKLYLAPEAYDGFSFKRSIIQGSDEKTNPASIQLELTYTLVK